MKISSQSRSFVKQVQVDLVALSDADLCNVVQQWVDGSRSSPGGLDVPEETRLALGYTPAFVEVEPFLSGSVDASEEEVLKQWKAPSPQRLRALLRAMDVPAFAQHVISYAYHALHPAHPRWYEGITFNAHLANFLRRMREETVIQSQRPRVAGEAARN